MTGPPRVMIAAAHKSSGKTVVSTGLTAALTARGDRVAPFKKGPDYIDPMWLSQAAGRPSYNLDFNTQSHDEARALFASRAAGADIALVEANKGLFDGVALDGADSNAAMARLLKAPVVLVVETRGMTRGIAPLLLGYLAFDPEVSIAGVILNRTGGARHEGKLRAAVEAYTDLPVLGAVRNAPELDISERHLGLTTPMETPDMRALIDGLGARLGADVDLDRLTAIARAAPDFGPTAPMPTPQAGPPVTIGVARDEAFGFYYADDMEAFEAAGARIVPIDMIRDQTLPPIDGLFIGGGFPEARARELSANTAMRAGLRAALAAGLPCYAECGGLMYLSRSLSWRGERHEMVGWFDADAVMHDRPQGRGHVVHRPTAAHPWRAPDSPARAHEFHYASLEHIGPVAFARTVERGHGVDGVHDGLVRGATLAGFIHLRHSAAGPWVAQFLDFVRAARP